MKIDLVRANDVVKEDNRNSKFRYLPTDAICLVCGCINNSVSTYNCVVCSCKCGNRDFIYGQLSIDLRLLLGFNIDDLRDLCEIRGIFTGSRAQMTVRLLREFHIGAFDERVNEVLVRKILKRNKRKFRFTVDLECAVQKAKKEIKLKLVSEEDVLK